MTQRFKLYQEERHWWTFSDYAEVLRVMAIVKPKRVLEFGPGSSTLALIEGGAETIDACEDDMIWHDVYTERLQKLYPGKVRMRPYIWDDPITVPGIDGESYDMALIDGPRDLDARTAAIVYAALRSPYVLIPTEEHSEGRNLRAVVDHIAGFMRRPYTINITGPLSGAFALIGPNP